MHTLAVPMLSDVRTPASAKSVTPQTETDRLARTLSASAALRLNLLDMIGVGPFITLPLLVAAMGGPQAMLGWICGALLALCDGLVWAELGAAMPEAGGTYVFLRRTFGGNAGRALSFLFLFQLLFSAPLSIASGGIGLAQYAGFLAPALASHATSHTVTFGGAVFGIGFGTQTLVAMAAIVLALALLYRNVGDTRRLSAALLAVVLFTIGATVAVALWRGHLRAAFAFPPHAFTLSRSFLLGLGSAMLVATYDYWGYYNVAFLGGEVRDPARTLPRVMLGSIGIVAVLYLALNLSILSVLPASALVSMQALSARQAMLPAFVHTAFAGTVSASTLHHLEQISALLVIVTAFGSVFSLLLGYSRIPYAAARDGQFFAPFARLHPTRNFPHISLLALAAAACAASFFSLAAVVSALVVLRILLQFLLQHVGVMLWRRRAPDAPRPFRIWLYPLPPLAAIAGFLYIVVSRPGFARECVLAALVASAGLAIFAIRQALALRSSKGVL